MLLAEPVSYTHLDVYKRQDYIGTKAPHAEVSIYYGKDTWREGLLMCDKEVIEV